MWHDITRNGALHCICMGTSHIIGVSAWLKINTRFGVRLGRLGTVGQSLTKLHG